MINLFNAQIESLSLHKIGNKSRNESVLLTDFPYVLNDEISPLLKEYFFKSFRKATETYFQFYHEVDLAYNQMFSNCRIIFDNPDEIHHISKDIAMHLFEQSNHPHIKRGEIFVTYLKNVTIDNKVVDAIGIFKSENQNDFIKIEDNGETKLSIQLFEGIALDNLDKGCIIFNYKSDEGYKILTIDNNRYDSRYWLDHFLQINQFEDERFITKKYLDFAKEFANKVILPAQDAQEQALFKNRTIHHFATNDEFNEKEFIEEMFSDSPDLKAEYVAFKADIGPKYSVEDITEFSISNEMVNEIRPKYKNNIKLDTNMEIKLDFANPESAVKFLEKGWDEERQMYYYLLYYNKEEK